MTLKMAHRVLLRVLWCDVVFPGKLEWLLFSEDAWGDPPGDLKSSYVGFGILVRVF
tara:strand:+ start:315 stop:482 length:168 start_codon:yes stop_codon:yes gene_type:complete